MSQNECSPQEKDQTPKAEIESYKLHHMFETVISRSSWDRKIHMPRAEGSFAKLALVAFNYQVECNSQ